jgi:anti-sigma regulatory factor (Ser/Thr protein kinase)
MACARPLELLVTELASNVVRHSGLGHDARMEMHVRIEPGQVRVEVHDKGRGFPAAREMCRRPDEVGGNGLQLSALPSLPRRKGAQRAVPI